MCKAVEQDLLLREALRLVTKALELVDEDGTVTFIGAQLDLARVRLSEHLETSRSETS